MSRLPNEDLFDGSKMTFGEHLEELRVVLFRSMLGIAIGIVIGFMFANQVITFVETPLLNALDDFYTAKNEKLVRSQYGDQLSQEEMDALVASIAETGRTFEEVYFERDELKRIFSGDASAPATTPAGDVSPAATKLLVPPSTDLVKTRMWKDTPYKIQVTNAQEPFFAWMKVGIVTGLTIAAPWVFFQLWMFVAEGLYPTEKKYVYLYLPFSLALFFFGASLAFFFVFKPVLGFLFSFCEIMNADPVPRISEWLSFFLLLPLGFGIGFQLPLVMLFLNRIGVVSVEVYLSQWRIAVLIIFVAAMILTPADPQSMLLLAVPLTALYFLGILLCKYLPKRASPFGEGYDPT